MIKLRLVCISDLHQCHDALGTLPKGDVLVDCGDMTDFGHYEEIDRYAAFLEGVRKDFRKILVTPGNHEDILAGFLGEVQRRRAETRLLLAGADLVIKEERVIDGFRFFLSPGTPRMSMSAFGLKDDLAASLHWAAIPSGIDVLITHAPARGILDASPARGDKGGKVINWGCPELLERISDVSPALHVFGHVHAQGGKFVEGDYAGRKCLHANAALQRGRGNALGRPVVIDLERDEHGRVSVAVVSGPK